MKFAFPGLRGGIISLEALKGRAVLIVNTASQCGFTPQYAALEWLHEKKQEQGLTIIGVPCDDFGGQEPADENGIGEFCRVNYGVNFPMTEKLHVKGPEIHPFYAFAAQRFGWLGKPKWNFHKYLLNRQGELVDYFHSFIAPDSGRLVGAVDKQLKG